MWVKWQSACIGIRKQRFESHCWSSYFIFFLNFILLSISLLLLYIIYFIIFYSLLFFIILLGMDPKCLLTSTDLQMRRARCQHQLSFLLDNSTSLSLSRMRDLCKEEAQLMPTNPRDALKVSQGHQTWYHSMHS